MSLNWSVAEIKDHEKVTTHPKDPKRWNPVTEALVWHSMFCGFNRITEQNWQDVFKRISKYEKVFGACRRRTRTPPRWTRARSPRRT
jgi:hypothetical protein